MSLHVISQLGRQFETDEDYKPPDDAEVGAIQRVFKDRGGLTINTELVLLTVTSSSPSVKFRRQILSTLRSSREDIIAFGLICRAALVISRLWAAANETGDFATRPTAFHYEDIQPHHIISWNDTFGLVRGLDCYRLPPGNRSAKFKSDVRQRDWNYCLLLNQFAPQNPPVAHICPYAWRPEPTPINQDPEEAAAETTDKDILKCTIVGCFLAAFFGEKVYDQIRDLLLVENPRNGLRLDLNLHRAFDNAGFTLVPDLQTIHRDAQTGSITQYDVIVKSHWLFYTDIWPGSRGFRTDRVVNESGTTVEGDLKHNSRIRIERAQPDVQHELPHPGLFLVHATMTELIIFSSLAMPKLANNKHSAPPSTSPSSLRGTPQRTPTPRKPPKPIASSPPDSSPPNPSTSGKRPATSPPAGKHDSKRQQRPEEPLTPIQFSSPPGVAEELEADHEVVDEDYDSYHESDYEAGITRGQRKAFDQHIDRLWRETVSTPESLARVVNITMVDGTNGLPKPSDVKFVESILKEKFDINGNFAVLNVRKSKSAVEDGGHSLYNMHHQVVVMQIADAVQKGLHTIELDFDKKGFQFMHISPYRAEAEMVALQLDKLNDKRFSSQSIDKVQGITVNGLVIVSVTADLQFSKFVGNLPRMLVALSRQKWGLVIIKSEASTDPKTYGLNSGVYMNRHRTTAMWYKLVCAAESAGCLKTIPAPSIEACRNCDEIGHKWNE
ncbi:uncharacterized protein BP5553_10006 [Venustampulla echinocandica]|uniref:DNA2/NAM7 helicase-like C-terminal domain-containing protein n=1 Tax=Venustampulla echinocandica TaxID=2656787 RepID=A0A370TA57_9HELO|nr:uncharacterized protein BP5553_10006 [Venustampulla echinocandica]RDL30661.1 hypothetical protein BP5553_10006 [Venustampulla echinocandica]